MPPIVNLTGATTYQLIHRATSFHTRVYENSKKPQASGNGKTLALILTDTR